MDLNHKDEAKDFLKPEKHRSKKKYSVHLKQNNVELSALSKPVAIHRDGTDDEDSLIGVAVRHGRRSVITKAIEKAKKNNNLDSLDSVGFAALHHTTRYCRLEAIEKLLKSGADVNVLSRDDFFTPLHIAARFGWYEAVQILLKHGADATLQCGNGATALHLACKRGCSRIVELLLKQPSVDVNAKDKSLRIPLHLAASQGHEEVVNILLENGADVFAVAADRTTPLHVALMSNRICVYSGIGGEIGIAIMRKACEIAKIDNRDFMSLSHDMDGYTILHIIPATNNIKVMEMALDIGIDINIVNTKNNNIPLHVASQKGFLQMVEFLVQRGANIHAEDINGKTPLHYAAQLGHNDIITFFIEKGADVDSRDTSNKTPFLLAASSPKANISTMQLLIEKGADVIANEAFMKNCLHLAVESENYEMVEFLLGVDSALLNLHSPDVDEKVPLHYAAQSGSLKILKLLLTQQRRLNLQDEDQKTAIYLAAKNDRAEHVEALGRAGASVNDRDDEGKTALHAAASRGSKKVCKILITLGTDVNCKDSRDRTPLMYAAEAGCTKTVKALLNHNAGIDDASLDGDTALLSAIRSNNSAVVELLMERNVDVIHRDVTGAGVVETAVRRNAKDSIKVICSHERWREVLNDTGSPQGQRPMQLLIAHFPEAATAVLDKCITRPTNIIPTHRDYTITYDFELLDPGPDDPDFVACNRYFGPKTMVKYNRQDLLLHPLTETLLNMKWDSLGKYVHYSSLAIYLWFMITYSYFVIHERKAVPARRNRTKISEIYTAEGNYNVAVMVMAFVLFQLAKEIFQIILQRRKYFKQPENLLEWLLYVACLIFLTPFVAPDDMVNWLYGNALLKPKYLWVPAILSIMLCYMNFVLFLRRFTLFGIYINMFLVVFRSLVKVMLVFMQFIVAFAVVFFILFKEQSSFLTFGHSLMKTIVMTIGEVDFTSTFIDSLNQTDSKGYPLNPFPEMALIFCALFVYAMCITLMNLLIGLAIGDIDNVQRSAELQRLAMQVDFVVQIEEKFPRFITRRFYHQTFNFMPNKKSPAWRMQQILLLFKGALKDLTTTTGEASSERKDVDLNDMAAALEKNRRQIKALVTAMEAQSSMIKSISEKLDTQFKDSLQLQELMNGDTNEEEENI